jgi:hypothetical protein
MHFASGIAEVNSVSAWYESGWRIGRFLSLG